jgi:SAM-dependent methyltransferase
MDRIHIIQELVRKFNYNSYLEIGVASGASFGPIGCAIKVGVDPRPDGPATIRLPSDAYFEQYPNDTFDIIFIDGLHHSDQVTRDIENSLKVLNPGGTIVMHDCSPTTRAMQDVPWPPTTNEWTGDVWKAFVDFRTRYTYEAFVVDCDLGVGVIRPSGRAQEKLVVTEALDFDNLVRLRTEWLNLISTDRFTSWINA